MVCDKCKGEIDEREGYLTIKSSLSARFSWRDTQNRWITMPAAKEINTIERTCYVCACKANVNAARMKE